ncbi:hypothetical protein HOLleu_05648 [Holothuria leucospilota]|uniref:Integrase catalytic domain-containing protein n=1 Tax=Holothuria leucospilota TaxID=206669 RepID=A0A9Q1CLQ8_HOLLE|nr:hypothetical protein HOLleu_05648 [Holothuria leucospilota]
MLVYVFFHACLHLEMICGMDMGTFLNAFNRFIGRGGKPEYAMSDNGLNFIGAENELKELMKKVNE